RIPTPIRPMYGSPAKAAMKLSGEPPAPAPSADASRPPSLAVSPAAEQADRATSAAIVAFIARAVIPVPPDGRGACDTRQLRRPHLFPDRRVRRVVSP